MNLTGQQIKDTYEGLLNIGATGLTGALQTITDGLGNPLPMQVSNTTVNFTGIVTGIVGTTGPAGPTGANGATGAQGPTGAGGASATGALQTDAAISSTLQVVKDSLGNSSVLRISCVDVVNYGAGGIDSNVAFGKCALVNNSSGTLNTAIGRDALKNNTGTGNTAIGWAAGCTITSTTSSTFVGYFAGLSANGNYNTGIGAESFSGLTSGSYNTALGFGNGQGLSSGSYNIIVGRCSNTDGATNYGIAIGHKSCAKLDNAIAIGGSDACSTAVCSITIGNTSTIFPGATGTIVLGNSSVGGTGACNSVVIGNSSYATKQDSIVIGNGAYSNIASNILIGKGANAVYGTDGIAIGNNAQTSNFNGIAIGNGSLTNGSMNIGFCNGLYNGADVVGYCNGVNGGSFAFGKYNNGFFNTQLMGVCNTGHYLSTVIGQFNSASTAEYSSLLGQYNIACVGSGNFQQMVGSCNTVLPGATGTSILGYCNTGGNGVINSVILGNNIISVKSNTTHVNSLIAYGQAASLAYAIGSTGTAISVDWDNSNVQTLTITASGTLSMANPIEGGVYTLQITQGVGGGHTITWTNVKWPGGAPPSLSITAGATDILTFIYGPTAYFGNANLNFS